MTRRRLQTVESYGRLDEEVHVDMNQLNGAIYTHLAKALELGELSEVLWMLGVVLGDMAAPELHKIAIRNAKDAVDHEVVRGLK